LCQVYSIVVGSLLDSVSAFDVEVVTRIVQEQDEIKFAESTLRRRILAKLMVAVNAGLAIDCQVRLLLI
jgi:hypothetical protein